MTGLDAILWDFDQFTRQLCRQFCWQLNTDHRPAPAHEAEVFSELITSGAVWRQVDMIHVDVRRFADVSAVVKKARRRLICSCGRV